MSNENILNRIRKLIAMASDERGNEHERETALRQAHALLTKHGLDLQDVEKFEREKMDPRGKFTDEGWSMRWTHQIRNSIARLFMCRYFTSVKISGTRQKHIFVGRESNATTAMYMSAYVVESVLKEARKLYKHNLSAETRLFALGVAATLHQRINEMIAEQTKGEKAESTSRALAVVNMIESEARENDEFIAGWNIKRARSTSVNTSGQAYANGQAFGRSVNLNLQVSKPASQQLT